LKLAYNIISIRISSIIIIIIIIIGLFVSKSKIIPA
jgi:hypothetical protein